MSKYTAEQVFLRSEDVKYSADIDFRLTPACAADICKMLRDYAEHLRERESASARVPDDAEAVSACLGDDASAMLDANPDDERALNMQRASQIIDAMLDAEPKRGEDV